MSTSKGYGCSSVDHALMQCILLPSGSGSRCEWSKQAPRTEAGIQLLFDAGSAWHAAQEEVSALLQTCYAQAENGPRRSCRE